MATRFERRRTPPRAGRAPTSKEGEMWKQSLTKEASAYKQGFNQTGPELPWLEAATFRGEFYAKASALQADSPPPSPGTPPARQHGHSTMTAGSSGSQGRSTSVCGRSSPAQGHGSRSRELASRVHAIELELAHEKEQTLKLRYALRAATYQAATTACSVPWVSMR